MLNTKFVEIRDRRTLVPALAFYINRDDGYLARRAGFGEVGCVFLIMLATERCSYDPYHWGDRTMQTAHGWLVEHWNECEDGAVLDVEFLLGESAVPKTSEEFDRSLLTGYGA